MDSAGAEEYSRRMKQMLSTSALSRQMVVISGTCLLLGGCSPKPEPPKPPPPPKATAAVSNQSIAAAPSGYIAKAVKVKEEARATVGIENLQKAVESFQLEEGRNPASLEEVIQKGFLKTMPNAGNGQKFEYDAKTGNVKIVSQ
jgi:competence protein ComGC